MRKYFKPENLRKRDSLQKIERELDPWMLLECYVKRSASILGIDTVADVISACRSKSVTKYLSLVSRLEARAQLYSCSDDVRLIYAERQVCALLKKYPFTKSDLNSNPREEAINSLLAAEEKCRLTNERIAADQAASVFPSWVPRCRAIISDILGTLSPELIMKIISSGKHGPGSTASSRGNRVTEYYKYLDIPYTVTDSARLYAFAAISSDPKWIDYLESTGRRKELPPSGSPQYQKELMLLKDVVDEVANDKITFVPKTCKTDRPIAVGASLNIFLQLGVKAHMEKRLKMWGVDLTDQTKNQRFALLGSKFNRNHDDTPNTNQFSTIDLASASDTISVELVKCLLPGDWFAFLDDLRHKSGTLEGKTIHYQKFCAMGNGFTFPLESLLFYSICKSAIEEAGFPCTPNDISIYGDDIIVREKTVPHVLRALQYSGFSVNTEKSFVEGPFKESCGCDYFQGINVRPYYLKRAIRTYRDIYHVCNRISEIILSRSYNTCLDTLYEQVLSSMPKNHITYGPISADEGNLSCPMAVLNNQGLRPYLSNLEVECLVRSGQLKKTDVGFCLPYAVTYNIEARWYSSRDSVRYMITLRHKFEQAPRSSFEPNDPWLDTSMGVRASRRNSVKQVISVKPVLNWDNGLSRHDLYRHPLWNFIES
jgi:hypothetical protein